MKQWLGKVLMALAASAMIAGAFGALGESTAFVIGQRLPVTLSEEVQRLQFSPEVNNVYAVNLLPADDWGFSAETALLFLPLLYFCFLCYIDFMGIV